MRPARRRGHEQGGATIEFVGVMVVVVALAASVVVAVPPVGGAVADGLSVLVCRVVGVVTGQDCAAPEGTAAGDPGQVEAPGGPDADQPDAEDAGGDGDGEAEAPDGEGDDDGGFFDGVGDFFGGVGDVAGDFFGGVGDFFGGVGDFFGGLAHPFREAWDSIWQLVTNPLEWVDEQWDNLYDHVAFWNWDTWTDTWKEAGKEFVAWDEWEENWPRALGIVVTNVVVTVATFGIGTIVKRFLLKRPSAPETDAGDQGDGNDDAGDQEDGNDGDGDAGDQGNDGQQPQTPAARVTDALENPGDYVRYADRPQDFLNRLGGVPEGWRVTTLGQGNHAGQGWKLEQVTPGGNLTGRQIRWHPGGGRHGPDPYWTFTSGEHGTQKVVGPNYRN